MPADRAAGTVAAAILAGGRGRRLGGVVKALMTVEGRRILDRQLAVLAPLFPALAVVGGDVAWLPAAEAVGVAFIPDRAGPGLGPLAGLDAALAWLPAECQSVVCVASDMPFLSAAVVARLRDAAPASATAVVPQLGSGPEPLCARYHRRLASLVAAEIAAGRRSMRGLVTRANDEGGVRFVEEAELRTLDPELRTFRNLNTPDDVSAP